jgi:hypothetical protein
VWKRAASATVDRPVGSGFFALAPSPLTGRPLRGSGHLAAQASAGPGGARAVSLMGGIGGGRSVEADSSGLDRAGWSSASHSHFIWHFNMGYGPSEKEEAGPRGAASMI